MSLDPVVLISPVSGPMEHSSLLTSLFTRILGKVVLRPQEHQHELPTLMRKRPVDAHPDGEVVHQIRTRTVMEGPPLLPERRIHSVATVARLRLGMPRRARLTHTRMVAKHRLGTRLHGRLIHIKTVVKPLRGMPHRGLPTHMRTVIPRTGLTMAAERLVRVGAEDGGVVLRITTHGATRHLRGQPTQVTPHG